MVVKFLNTDESKKELERFIATTTLSDDFGL